MAGFKFKDPCGCTHDGYRWMHVCGMHTAVHDEFRAASAEHRGANVHVDRETRAYVLDEYITDIL